jgi:toxin CcdB
MARFDVYANPDSSERKDVPYLLDVQNSYLGIIHTTVVIPLHSAHRFDMQARNLNPVFEIKGQSVVMNTAGLGAIPSAELRRPVDNMASKQTEITDALDTLFGGY